ncbi:hypothetical protein LWF01_02305 [Saxibacter everestensis]|uniref:Cellulose biosynthesis protein BcsQ n=1 Tax=Saxibacter everestensis TaxID=2909229 RepID=A0ABY8QUX7_9MICO|nr:hypothetical protein LWF01_02305 [Brevibacteriaceae bacterium ZFBP1038]
MAVVLFTAAKGAPGVTTTAMLAASLWPRSAVLVDADPAGGDIGLRLPLADGRPVDMNRGLLTLLPLARRSLAAAALLDHSQRLLGGTDLIAGLAGPEQASAVGPLWNVLAGAFSDLPGHDVLIDAGNLHGSSVQFPLARSADLIVFVMRPRLADVIHTRSRLTALRSELVTGSSGNAPDFGVIVVAADREFREAESTFASLGEAAEGARFFGAVSRDKRGIDIFNGGTVHRPERTHIVRTGRVVVDALAQAIGIEAPAARGTAKPAARKTKRGKEQDRRAVEPVPTKAAPTDLMEVKPMPTDLMEKDTVMAPGTAKPADAAVPQLVSGAALPARPQHPPAAPAGQAASPMSRKELRKLGNDRSSKKGRS